MQRTGLRVARKGRRSSALVRLRDRGDPPDPKSLRGRRRITHVRAGEPSCASALPGWQHTLDMLKVYPVEEPGWRRQVLPAGNCAASLRHNRTRFVSARIGAVLTLDSSHALFGPGPRGRCPIVLCCGRQPEFVLCTKIHLKWQMVVLQNALDGCARRFDPRAIAGGRIAVMLAYFWAAASSSEAYACKRSDRIMRFEDAPSHFQRRGMLSGGLCSRQSSPRRILTAWRPASRSATNRRVYLIRKETGKMKRLIALTVGLLAACSSESGAWEPDGAFGALDHDKRQCMAQAKMVPSTGNVSTDADSQDEFFHACMHRMGWKER